MKDPVIGWLVLTNGPNGWQDDWDGEVHKTLASAQLSFASCQSAGHECLLVTAIESSRFDR